MTGEELIQHIHYVSMDLLAVAHFRVDRVCVRLPEQAYNEVKRHLYGMCSLYAPAEDTGKTISMIYHHLEFLPGPSTCEPCMWIKGHEHTMELL